jgi:hypothetical protein
MNEITYTKTTKPLHTIVGTNNLLAEFDTLAYTVHSSSSTRYTICFKDVDAALAAVEQAKDVAWARYIKNGGNPRNNRAHGSQFAAVKKAIIAAA